jgi:N-acyl-D-aspartate/D-glutamate deacylase
MKRASALAALLLAAIAMPGAAFAADTYDIVIKGGRVIDPASGRDEVADIGITGRSIAAISTAPLQGRRTLDAKGMVVSPGFIDLHAHAQNPKGEYYQLLDGVTTSMDMEIGTMPIADFFASLQGKALINFGASASHICARIEVMIGKHCLGESTRSDDTSRSPIPLTAPATEEQEARIVAAMNREIAAGALGYGVGIEYAPGSGRREIYRIFQAAAASHAPVFVHVRSRPKDRAPGVPMAVAQEVIADAVSTGASLQLVHVTSTGLDDTPAIIDMIKGARAHGADITTEAYPYTAGSTGIGTEFFSDGWQQRNGISYGDLQWPATGERLTEQSFNLYRKTQPDQTVIVHVIPPAAVEVAMADPIVSIASDGISWTTGGEHPRGAGTFSRVLGLYVREKHVLDLKTALAKMTIMPARRLETVSPQMARKGRIQIGADADITVFDPARIKDMATYEKPMQPSIGIRYVLVGGQVMATNGKVTLNLFPGVAIRSGKAQ